jgi:hypothetical protein
VADNVLSQDRRAWWMEAWLTGALAYVTEPVLEKRAPVRTVVHDEEGDWQLLCETVAPDEARRMHLHHAIDDDPSIAEVLDLGSGERADRDGPREPWRRTSSA